MSKDPDHRMETILRDNQRTAAVFAYNPAIIVGRRLRMPLSARQLPFLVATLIPLLASPVQALDLNGYRKTNGLKPMSAHGTLAALARAHAADMARRGT